MFGPAPDETYTGKLAYWKRLDVSASAHTLFTRNPDLYLYGSLAHSAPFIGQDERLATWVAIFERLMTEIARVDVHDRTTGGELQVDSDARGP